MLSSLAGTILGVWGSVGFEAHRIVKTITNKEGGDFCNEGQRTGNVQDSWSASSCYYSQLLSHESLHLVRCMTTVLKPISNRPSWQGALFPCALINQVARLDSAAIIMLTLF
ncbi:hypothetical protein GGR57DRAFT_158424 [Xylariaceae sp. FL1272]|nr:hypothetical protein GGR57DRAFT_158424 [Xylariaceae sp. FL1272]